MSQNLVSIESMYKKKTEKKHHLSNLDNTLAKTSEISFQEGVAVKPLLQLPSSSINFSHLHPLQAEPPQATTQVDSTEIPLASATEPFTSRRIAKFRAEVRVLGCSGPS